MIVRNNIDIENMIITKTIIITYEKHSPAQIQVGIWPRKKKEVVRNHIINLAIDQERMPSANNFFLVSIL